MTDDNLKNRIIGDRPGRTVLHLVIASIIVGSILALLGLSPLNFWRGIFDGLKDVISAIGDSAGEVIVNLATYLILGAAIVLPIWLVSRLLKGRRNPPPK